MIRKITNTILMLRTIRHYRRMIALAKTLPKGDRVDHSIMEDAIGESWNADNCPYCRRYYYTVGYCSGCPLDISRSSHRCCGGIWVDMADSQTWGEWVERADAVKKYVWKHGI